MARLSAFRAVVLETVRAFPPHEASNLARVLASFSLTRYRLAMSKDAYTLSDVREPTLTIVCQPCGRRGRYNVERLMAKHGDAKILFVLPAIANCPKARSVDVYDLCKARYEGLRTRWRLLPLPYFSSNLSTFMSNCVLVVTTLRRDQRATFPQARTFQPRADTSSRAGLFLVAKFLGRRGRPS